MKVSDLMTTDVATVGADASLKEVASILVERRISGLPVVDDAGSVLGVVSEGDIIQREAIAPSPRGGLFRWLDVESDEIRAKLAAPDGRRGDDVACTDDRSRPPGRRGGKPPR